MAGPLMDPRVPGGRVPPERYPWWVKFSLMGAKTRNAQWFWVIASIVAGVIVLLLVYTDRRGFDVWLGLAGLWGFAAAGLYFATILWMDRNGNWG
jgi:hypothetical protein